MSSFPPNNNFAATCPRCGKQLMSNETQCTRCGLSIPANLLNRASQAPNNQAGGWQGPQNQYGQPMGGGAPWSGQQGWGQAAPPDFPQQGPAPADDSDATQINRGGFLPPFPSTLSQPRNNFQAPPQSGGFRVGESQQNPFQSGGFQSGGPQTSGFQGGAPQNNGFARGGFQNNSFQNNSFGNTSGNYQNPGTNLSSNQDFQVMTPKRKNKLPRILLIVLILLVLVGGGLGAYYVMGHNGGNGTGSSGNTGMTLAKPASAPIFKDAFASNTNGWDLTSNPGSFSAKIGGGSMVLEDDNHLLLPALLPSVKTKNLHNFRMSVDAALTHGDPKNGYGMIFRCTLDQNGDLANYYGFEVYGDGTYIIFKHAVDAKGNATRTQIGGDLDNPNGLIQKSTNVNHMTVIAKNSTLQFYVNNQLLTTVQDSSFQSGLASLFVSNVQSVNGGAQGKFSNLAVYAEK